MKQRLDKIRRDFLWEGNKDHKIHLVKWAKVTLPKQYRGLGIKDLALHNKCMLLKWHWRYNQEATGLWKEVIQAKCGGDSHRCSNKVSTSCATGVWRDIRKLWETFFSDASLMVGNGEHIQFWKDIWLGDIPLMNDFPNIFQIASHPNSTISQYREDNVWNLILRRNLNDWELEEVFSLMATIQTSAINTPGQTYLLT